MASYVATLPVQIESDAPSGFAVYAVEALNPDGRGAGLSNQIRVAAVRTIPSPPNFDARVTGAGVVLEWTSNVSPGISSPSVHFVYRVYRSEVGRTERILVGEVPAGGDRALTLSDSSLVWEKTYEYRVDTVTVIAQENKPHIEVEGDDSPAIKVLAHDVFPPAVPSGLQAVFSGPGQQSFIDLIWAPVSDVDLDGYNVYRHEEGTAPVKINTALLKTPAYRDSIVAAGRHYSYSVSAVDVRGNESARSEEAGESVP